MSKALDVFRFLFQEQRIQWRSDFIKAAASRMKRSDYEISALLDALIEEGTVCLSGGVISPAKDGALAPVGERKTESAVLKTNPLSDEKPLPDVKGDSEKDSQAKLPPADTRAPTSAEKKTATPASEVLVREAFVARLYRKMETFAFEPPIKTLDEARETRELVIRFAEPMRMMDPGNGFPDGTILEVMSVMTRDSPQHERFMSFAKDVPFYLF